MREWIAIVASLVITASTEMATERRAAVTMILLERDGCFGACPEYSVRVTTDGSVRFEGKGWVREFGRREGRVSAEDYRRLVQAVDAANFDDLPSEFPPSACATFATDQTTVWLTVMKDSTLKRIRYYFGCEGGRFKDDFARIGELADQIDEIVGTSRWIGLGEERRPTRCLQYEPFVVSLHGTISYDTFVNANGQRERHPLLILRDPICVDDGGDQVNIPEANQFRVQLSMDPEKFGGEPALAGQRVVITGALYHGHTAHHHVPLLLTVQNVELEQPNKPLQPTRQTAPRG